MLLSSLLLYDHTDRHIKSPDNPRVIQVSRRLTIISPGAGAGSDAVTVDVSAVSAAPAAVVAILVLLKLLLLLSLSLLGFSSRRRWYSPV